MACVEDCDQILIAPSIQEEQGWEENGECSGEISASTLLLPASFQHDDDSLDGGWGRDSLDSKEKDWESWGESSISETENVFDMMRDGSLSQVSGFVSKYGLEYSLGQRDEYGHTPTHWLALNGHAHVFR